MGMSVRVGFLASLLAVSACGGGGGGGGPTGPNALLAGSYVYLYLDRDVAGNGIYSEVATFAADGAGGIVFGQGWQTGEGGPGVYVRRANSLYSVTEARDLTVAGGFPSQLTGAVSSGGTYATASALSGGSDPGWFCAARRDTSPTLAEVVGSWHFVEWQRNNRAPDVSTSLTGRITVDAVGNISSSGVHYNQNGSIDPGMIVFLASRFEIGGPGGLQVFSGATLVQEGGMSANGDVILLANRTSAYASVELLVREGLATSSASVQGAWRVSGYASTLSGYLCAFGSATFDGVADGTWGANANLDGTPGWSAEAPIDYAVGGSGQASVLWPGVSQIFGGAAPGFLLFGGPLTPARGPALHVLIR